MILAITVLELPGSMLTLNTNLTLVCIVQRQNNPDLIDCVNDLEKVDFSDNSVAFLNSLNRPIQNEADGIQLFAWNTDVDLFNFNKLLTFPSEPKYIAAIMKHQITTLTNVCA